MAHGRRAGVPLRFPPVPALAVVQARLSSTRLPGKVLADVEGEPMLALLLRRLSRATTVGRIVVATSDDPSDDRLAAVAGELGAEVCRGPLHDVLGRFVLATDGHPGPYLRITADCPLIDPDVVDALVERFTATPVARYGSNVEPTRTYPDGLDTELFSAEALAVADRLATTPEAREHVTLTMREDPEQFPAVYLSQPERLGELRWTVDNPADLEFVRRLTARLGDRRYLAGQAEILAAVRRAPSLAEDGLRG